MTVAAIHQPGYFPWYGLVEKIARADVFVVLDNVQFNRAAYQHRTLYSSPGAPKLLTLPVKKAGLLEDGRHIRDIELADVRTPSKHFETLRGRYRRSPGWNVLEAALSVMLRRESPLLMDYSVPSLRFTLEQFGVAPKLVFASDLACKGTKSALVIDIVKAVGCDTYLSGTGAHAYQAAEEFDAAGIRLLYQNLHHPKWKQSHGGDFQAGCFALEWLIEEGAGACDTFSEHLKRTAQNAFLTPDQLAVKTEGLP